MILRGTCIFGVARRGISVVSVMYVSLTVYQVELTMSFRSGLNRVDL